MAAKVSRTIWIVDDSPLDAERVRRVLSSRYEVEVFLDGSAALERLSSDERPDLLVLDWVMPGVSGPDVCRFVRQARAPLCDLSILLLTAMQNTEQVVEGLQAGANDYLPKPYANAELEARVESLLKQLALLERARKAEETARACLARVPDALVSVDAQATVVFLNDEAEQVFGRALAELRGKPLYELLPDVSLERLRAIAHQRNGAVPDVKVGGRIFAPSMRVVPMNDASTTTIALRDVTRQRQNEARRLDFYSMIAHDLRSPLSALLLRTQLILRGQRGPISAELRRDVQRIEHNIRSMVGMISDFLDLARMESGNYEIRRDPIALDALAERTVDELAPVGEASHIQLSMQKCAEPVEVAGDAQRLNQVLVNLLSNALKFTPSGGRVVVSVDRIDGYARLGVSDTGRGIPPEELTRIFERYTRATGTEHGVTGSGLGLLIVREIVEAHGGHVSVTSTVGQGSTFVVELPLATAESV